MYSKTLILILILINIIFVTVANGYKMDLYSALETNAIDELRSLVQDVIVRDFQNRDYYLIKWLTANEMNVNDAATKFRETMKWRKDEKIDSIGNETILEFNPKPYLIDGHDKEGHPLVLITPTLVDLRKLIIQGSKDKVLRYFFQMIENAVGALLKIPEGSDGRNITRVTIVFDIHGYNLRQHFCFGCIQIYTEWLKGMERHYPEGLKHVVFINTPKIANDLVEIVRPVLSPATKKAVKSFDPNKKEWSAYLLKIISKDQLPYRFGGTKKY